MSIVVQAQLSLPHASESLANEQHVRAASDLLSRIQRRAPRRIADVQAGPRSTKVLLAERFPDAEIVSLDASCAERAHRNELDLIFLNGDLDLLPSLRELLPVLVTRLSFGGCLAVQIPDNLYEPNRVLLRMVAADGPWATKLLPVAKTRPFNEMMEGLYALLSPTCASVDIWETTYLYALDGVSAIVDLMKATSLAPFLRPLDETSRGRFLDRYATELARSYRAQPDGKVLLRFPRIFVLARR
jgi:trans-aconitate 2-methyltransferase